MKKIVCIVCPNGCELSIDERTLDVSGNKCARGAAFAKTELTAPMRTVCTTVKTAFADCPVLPVRLSAEIPKERIFDFMKAVNAVTVTRRLPRGGVVIKNVLGLGADVIATSDILTKI